MNVMVRKLNRMPLKRLQRVYAGNRFICVKYINDFQSSLPVI